MRGSNVKSTRRLAIINTALLSALLITSGAAQAEGGVQQTQQALLKAQGLLKQLAQQRAQAEAEVARLRGELAGKERALAQATAAAETGATALKTAEASIAAGTRRETGLASKLEKTQTRLKLTDAKLHEVADLYKAMRTQQAETETARQTLEATLATTSAALHEAETHNLALYQMNRELLEQYQHKSAWDALRQREPLTGIASVAVENAVQDAEDRMAEELLPVNEAQANQSP